jgi:molybdopterin molybdotransferase
MTDHGVGWAAAREAAGGWGAAEAVELPLAASAGAVLAEDAIAPRAVPHYDSSAMDGWAVAGPPPWCVVDEEVLVPGQARVIVTGGALPLGADAVVPAERGTLVAGLLDASLPAPHAHVRRAGEEAPAGTVLVAAGTRLSPAHLAVIAIAGLDAVTARARPRVGFVLTGDEVTTSGLPVAGRVRDAFDPLLPLAVDRLGAVAMPPVRVGDDPAAIRGAIDGLDAEVVVTVGGTGRSGADRLREAILGAETVFDGVAMRPGHPALLARLTDGRPLLALPGNPLAAVAVLLSFLPPLIDAVTGATAGPARTRTASVDLPGWAGGTSLVPCGEGTVPAQATRPNMLRGLAASDVLAVVPPAGVRAGEQVQVLPLPW